MEKYFNPSCFIFNFFIAKISQKPKYGKRSSPFLFPEKSISGLDSFLFCGIVETMNLRN